MTKQANPTRALPPGGPRGAGAMSPEIKAAAFFCGLLVFCLISAIHLSRTASQLHHAGGDASSSSASDRRRLGGGLKLSGAVPHPFFGLGAHLKQQQQQQQKEQPQDASPLGAGTSSLGVQGGVSAKPASDNGPLRVDGALSSAGDGSSSTPDSSSLLGRMRRFQSRLQARANEQVAMNDVEGDLVVG